jgi:hypothetical protein
MTGPLSYRSPANSSHWKLGPIVNLLLLTPLCSTTSEFIRTIKGLDLKRQEENWSRIPKMCNVSLWVLPYIQGGGYSLLVGWAI